MTILSKYELAKMHTRFKCPICDAKLTDIDVSAWSEDNDGHWFASEISFSCTTEPDIDSDEWWDWFNDHYAMPYVDWMPLEVRILEWMKRTYRFAQGEPDEEQTAWQKDAKRTADKLSATEDW